MNKKKWIIITITIITIILAILLIKKFTTKNKYLADLVKIGDFVNYDAGVWTKEEIESLGQMYEEEPTHQGKFGKFKVGSNKNNSIEPYGVHKSLYNGWRVLSIKEDKVYLVHAGTPEGYYHEEGSSFDTEKILTGNLSEITVEKNGKSEATPRNWNMYVNEKYAQSATIFTKQMLDQWGKSTNTITSYNKTLSDDLIKIKASYWLGQAFNSGFVWRVGETGFIGYYLGDVLGIRPVVELKSDVQATKQVDEVVGTDGQQKAKVWQLK